MKFTEANVLTYKPPANKVDHTEWDESMPGFGIRMQGAAGKKTFIVMFRIGQRLRKKTLGTVGKVTLKAAKDDAQQIFASAAKNVDPVIERADAGTKAGQRIMPLIDRFLSAKEGAWAAKYHKDNSRYLKVSFQSLHTKALTEIKRQDVATELARIQTDCGDVTRNRARAALMAFFNWAIGEGECEFNPVDHTNKAHEEPRDRELSPKELKIAWHASNEVGEDFGKVFKLMVITLQREDQIGSLRVKEFNKLEQRLEFPQSRVKVKGKHWIPLSPQAMTILDSIDMKDREFVFGKWDTGFSNWANAKALLDAQCKFNEHWILHDLRRTGKTAMSEELEPMVVHEVSESILNHAKQGMDKVYNNAKYMKQKRVALDAYADHVAKIVS